MDSDSSDEHENDSALSSGALEQVSGGITYPLGPGVMCNKCSGSGRCWNCSGTGQTVSYSACYLCSGTGKCYYCGGCGTT